MKSWCKILELEGHDVLVQRLVNKEDGEHVKITVRFQDGQFIKSACLGDGDEAERLSIELYDKYGAKDAQGFVDELDKLMLENKDAQKNNKED